MDIGRPDAQQFRLTRTLFGRSGLRLEGKDHVGHQAKALAKLEIQLPIEFSGRRCSGVGRVIHMWRTDIFTFSVRTYSHVRTPACTARTLRNQRNLNLHEYASGDHRRLETSADAGGSEYIHEAEMRGGGKRAAAHTVLSSGTDGGTMDST